MAPLVKLGVLFILTGILGQSSAGHRDRQQNGQHPCIRECRVGSPPMECEYDFILEHYYTIGKACYDCPFNITDCSRPNCVAADGVPREIITVNRQIPGPLIWVCENDMIRVNVHNNLGSDSTTIHWHGLFQNGGFAHMDGMPMITQCPILPAASFTYRFKAIPHGTRFYHSHSDLQREEGMNGNLVIVQPRKLDIHSALYDYDLPEHVINIIDWMKESTLERFIKHNHQGQFGDSVFDRKNVEAPESILINGKGRFAKFKDKTTHKTIYTPLAVFNVKKNGRYRFRLINAGSFRCPLLFSIDNHKLIVIGADGHPVEPFEVDAIVTSAAERFDFILKANGKVDNYWIKVQGLVDCVARKTKQIAILRYNGAADVDPTGGTSYSDMARSGKILNPVHKFPSDTDIPVDALSSPDDPHGAKYNRKPDVQFYIALNTTEDDDPRFFDPDFNPTKGSLTGDAPQLNEISNSLPAFPLLHQFYENSKDIFCNVDNVPFNCTTKFCQCTHLLEVEHNQLVEMVLVDVTSRDDDSVHPIHLHGHSFRIVAHEKLGYNLTIQDIKDKDRAGKIIRNLENAVLKDTVTVPNKGYSIIRFVADNPGVWFMHCHLGFHLEKGMALTLKTGDPKDFPPVPKNFPRCGSFKIPDKRNRNKYQNRIQY